MVNSFDTLIGLADTTIPCQSGSRNNAYEGVFYIPENSSTGASSSAGLMSYPRNWLDGVGIVLPLCRDSVGVFYNSSRLGFVVMALDHKHEPMHLEGIVKI